MNDDLERAGPGRAGPRTRRPQPVITLKISFDGNGSAMLSLLRLLAKPWLRGERLYWERVASSRDTSTAHTSQSRDAVTLSVTTDSQLRSE